MSPSNPTRSVRAAEPSPEVLVLGKRTSTTSRIERDPACEIRVPAAARNVTIENRGLVEESRVNQDVTWEEDYIEMRTRFRSNLPQARSGRNGHKPNGNSTDEALSKWCQLAAKHKRCRPDGGGRVLCCDMSFLPDWRESGIGNWELGREKLGHGLGDLETWDLGLGTCEGEI